MGKNTKVICTVVPNPHKTDGYNKNNGTFRYYFSVFLTPRLPESGKLKDYYEMLNWPDFSEYFEGFKTAGKTAEFIRVHIAPVDYTKKPGPPVTHEYSILNESHPKGFLAHFDTEPLMSLRKTIRKQDRKLLYRQLFLPSTPVSGWLLNEGAGIPGDVKQIFSYEEILAYYEELQRQNPDDRDLKNNLEKVKRSFEEKNGLPFAANIHEISRGIAPGAGIAALTSSVRKFLKDTAGHHISAVELDLLNKENQEFHKKLSILSSYPHLMRLTGWILDFYVDAAEEPDFELLLNAIRTDSVATRTNRAVMKLDLSHIDEIIKAGKLGPNVEPWVGFNQEIDFKTPWTYFNPSDFSMRYAEILQEQYFEVKKGFIRPNDTVRLYAAQFTLNQLNFQNTPELPKVDSDAIAATVATDGEGLNKETQSTGISIFVPGKQLATAINANPDAFNLRLINNTVLSLPEANINDYILFGHNLDTGYRVDVARAGANGKPESFFSLCERVATYTVDQSATLASGGSRTLISNYPDEPWISESAQGGNSGTLYVNEELCRWNNWSLTCPHLGNYKTDDVDGLYEYNDLELKDIRPVQGSLLPLRFGEKYFFRLRIVDLCGNSAPGGANKTIGDDVNIGTDGPYKRFERVEPPEVFFRTSVFDQKTVVRTYHETQQDGTIKENKYKEVINVLKNGHAGELQHTMVIRTGVTEAGVLVAGTDECVRCITPPRINHYLAELHGAFDAIPDIENLFGFLSRESEKFLQVVDKGMGEITNIPFLSDPIVGQFLIEIPEPGGSKYLLSPQSKRIITDRKPTVFFLKNGDYGVSALNDISVSLPVGSLTQVNIYPVINRPDLLKTIPREIEWRGKKYPVGEKQVISLVHAVQRPVFFKNADNQSSVIDLKPVDRTPQDSISVRFSMQSKGRNRIPMGTTGNFRLIATFKEYVRNPEIKRGEVYEYETEASQVIQEFSNIAEFQTPKSSTAKLPVLKWAKENIDEVFLKAFGALQHSFGDTKFRQVTYTLELESRFKEFFDDSGKKNHFVRELTIADLTESTHVIKSSQRPGALKIDRIIHLLDWEEIQGYDGQSFRSDIDTVRRRNLGFRIYFKDKDWFATGAGECVALLFANNQDSVDDSLNGLVTEFGADAANMDLINNKRVVVNGEIKSDRFTGDEIGKQPFTSGNNAGSIDFIDSRMLSRESPGKRPATSQFRLKAKLFKVTFDGAQFYCDICFRYRIGFYFPFVKFALARYQENAITNYVYKPAGNDQFAVLDPSGYDYRLSTVVMTPAVQPLPDRSLWKNKGGHICLSPFGDAMRKGSGFYLIKEMKQNNEFLQVIDHREITKNTVVIRLNGRAAIEIAKNECDDAEAAYVEEFETYAVDDKFVMDESDANYNPRNDIRKRLIFSCKIK